ncbi:MAG: ATP-binding cassette domain-containing protein [Acholeplasmataceae bacterium]|jgi:branched-chain amino acid transport system ATP-binding protein|nr:ATP-binding cassette domain-containing protein [Acholeplasmataceae bacterium]
MEKITRILHKLQKDFYASIKQNIDKKLEFLKSYGLVYEEELLENRNRKLKKLENKHHDILKPLELDQLSNDFYLEVMIDKSLKKLNHTYSLNQKALKQSFKRKKLDLSSNEFQKKEADLKEKFEQKKENLKRQFERNLLDQTINANKMTYQDKVLELETSYKVYESELTTIDLKKLSDYHLKATKKISLLEEKVLKLKNKIQILNAKFESNIEVDVTDHLILQNLTMRFGGLVAVNDLSFRVKKGEIFGLIGPNGAGKTTVFNCITQFYKSSAGDIYYVNKNNETINLNNYKVHNVIKEGIARTFQNVEMVWELSVLDNLLVGSHSKFNTGFFSHVFHSKQLVREENVLRMKAIEILTKLGIDQYMHYYPFGLPYGILKKIELARTLMTNPSLIILDEPAAGLNEGETKELAQTIKTIQKEYGCTIFLVEHDMGLVMDICDTICAISFGKKLAIGTPKEIQSNKDVQTAYLGGE